MKKQKATIYDFKRYIKDKKLSALNTYFLLSDENIEQTNAKVLEWSKNNPVETRQDRFLKMFPNAEFNSPKKRDFLTISPCRLDTTYQCKENECCKCKEEYWLGEVEE